MRKLTIIEHISLDGIIQAPGGPDEDGDYPYGGWAAAHSDPEGGQMIAALHSKPFDLLLGRRTYDIWSGHWPKEEGPIAKGINGATKFVATHRPESLAWGSAKSLGKDIVAGVREMKSSAGPDVILWGSSQLTPVLLEHDLADEVMLLMFPVLLGKGKRFFSEVASPRDLALVSSKALKSGTVVNTYRPNGPLRTGTF